MAANDAIKVMCRFRPMNSSEKARDDKSLPDFFKENPQQVKFSGKTYTFDRSFGPTTTQEQLYDGAAKPIVADVLQGFNGTIFAYGQTSSGKTHTMEGVLHDEDMKGVIPRIVQDIFNHIYTLDQNLEFHIKISYFEIYLDKIRDLLDTNKPNLSVHEDANRVPYVKGATERFVASPEEVMQVMDEGKLNRKVASTKMNADSSRSHSIFLISVKQENMETETKAVGKLYLVDLAGSEKVGKTGAEGETLEEAKNINKSLSALGNVISALAEGVKSHIPYRDSKMTRILQDSLGGNCRTTIIICCSPASFNEAETKSTLLFGVRAKTIKNDIKQNIELTAEQWRKKFEKEQAKAQKYERLFRAAYEELQKWRSGEAVTEEDQVDFKKTAQQTSAPAAPLTTTAGSGDAPAAAAPAAPAALAPAATQQLNDILLSPSGSTVSPNTVLPPGPKPREIIENGDPALVQDLYNQLDEKDEQINKLTQLIEQLKEQLLALEELLMESKSDSSGHNQALEVLMQEKDQAKAEVNEVLAALEELAVNYDQKAQALDTTNEEVEKLANELQNKQTALTKLQSELANITELSETHKKRASDMLSGLLKDLYDLGIVSPSQVAQGVINESGPDSDLCSPVNFKNIDDEFTAARLLVSKVKSEIKTLVDKCDKFETGTNDLQTELTDKSQWLDETKKKLSQHENKIQTLTMCLKDIENKKRGLEDNVNDLHEEIARLRCQEQTRLNEEDEKPDQVNAVNEALDIQKQTHKVQMERIRTEIDEKSAQLIHLQENQDNLESELAQLKAENKQCNTIKENLSIKLAKIHSQNEKRDQARSDLRGLEDTVTRELSSLHNLRKLFVKELTERAKKIAVNDAAAASAGSNSTSANGTSNQSTPDTPTTDIASSSQNPSVGSQVQRQRIIFLENNLDQLTKVHKSLVRDNAELRCELPKLEKKLRATAERVKSLEQALREAKEGASKDRKRYQQEVDRIKETVRNRYIAKKAQIGAQIARPIRAGHAPGATFNSPVAIRGGGLAIHGVRGGNNIH